MFISGIYESTKLLIQNALQCLGILMIALMLGRTTFCTCLSMIVTQHKMCKQNLLSALKLCYVLLHMFFMQTACFWWTLTITWKILKNGSVEVATRY